MAIAAREEPLPIVKLLMEHSRTGEGADLVAQATLGDSWGQGGRMPVIEYLLDQGAGIDAVAASTWNCEKRLQMEEQFSTAHYYQVADGGQTALHIAQRAENKELVEFLLSRGADPSIQPIVPGRILNKH